MGLLTKLIKPKAEYQQWIASELTNGDIIDIFTSLGNREAHSVTIESLSGASTIRFNVGKKIYKEYGPMSQSWAGLGQGLPRPRPLLIDEVEETKPDIIIEMDSTQIWTSDEIRVSDIKIVTKSTGLKITVA